MIFKKVSELKATSGSAIDMVGTLLGYNCPGDGGGGEFYWDANSTVDPVDGIIFKVGTNAGRWIRLDQSVLFPEYFGAKGNGVADDHDAFEKMFLISGPCELMPNKTYLLSGNYTVDSRTLSLDGNGSTLQAHDSCNNVFITVTSTNNFYNYSTASYLFKNLNIIGPNPTKPNPEPANYTAPVTKSGTVGLYFYGEKDRNACDENYDSNLTKLIDNKLITSISIKKFDVGIDIFSNVWCLSIDKSSIKSCCVGVNSDKRKISEITSCNTKGLGSNYGENIRFNSCNISNNHLAIMNNGLDDLSFEGTSIDYNDCMVQVSEGRTKFINCYIERGNDQADVDYWIKMLGDGNWVKLFFDNCEFVFAQSHNPDDPDNFIKKYEIVYVETSNSTQPGSVIIQRSKINITNYERSHFMFSPNQNNMGGGLMQGNFYNPGYNGDHTRDFIPSFSQNSLRTVTTNDDNYSGWTFYTKDNINIQAYWENHELILSPNFHGHKRFAYYDVDVFEEEKTVSLQFLYQLKSEPNTKFIVKLQALDKAGNVISDLIGEIKKKDGDPLLDTMSNQEIKPITEQWNNGWSKWGKSMKECVINKYITYDIYGNPHYFLLEDTKTEGREEKWERVLAKYYSILPRGTRAIRLLFEGPDDNDNSKNDICKIKNIELCLE